MGLNPMTGVVIGFRHALLGTPISWDVVGVSLATCVLLFVVGLFIFRRLETEFADIL
jgi:lipopolysaccharide transport system permease protein